MPELTSFAIPKKFDIAGLKLPALAVVQVYERQLKLHKNFSGDFGFRIRRTNPTNDGNNMRVFADPSIIKSGPPRPNDILNNVLPGDELIEVNHTPISTLSREELQKIIEESGNEILLKVRTVPELVHLCGRSRRGIRDEGDALRLSTNNNVIHNDFDAIPEDSRYWLIHSEGYTVCQVLEHLQNNKIKIKVAGTQMLVDRSDIDRANPATNHNDISKLTYVNLTSAIHLLRKLNGSGFTYSHAGTLSLVSLTPCDEEYTNETLIDLFKGCRRDQMPSHIFSTAQEIYRNLQSGVKNQSIVFTGVSGSGKTSQMKCMLQYFCGVAGWIKTLPFKKLNAANTILDAFCNCRTILNKNASQCIRMYNLGFDTSAALCSANIKTFLLETGHLFRRSKHDTYFNIFDYLWINSDNALKEKLNLSTVGEQYEKYFIKQSFLSDENAPINQLNILFDAFKRLEFSSSIIEGIFDVLAAILHLKQAQAVDIVATRSCFIRTTNAQTAASLLGVSIEDLSKAVFNGQLSQTTPNIMSRSRMANRVENGQEALDSFIEALYQELVNSIVSLLNQKLNKSFTHSITLLDIPGANFGIQWADYPTEKMSTLKDLIINYCNERIAELFYDRSFTEPIEVYAREQVNVDISPPLLQPHTITRMIDRKPQLINSVNLEQRSEEERGLMHLLQEEAMFPAGCDASLLSRILLHFEENKLIRRHHSDPSAFILGHCHNTSPTAYSVEGWVREARPSHAPFTVPFFVKTSNKQDILDIFAGSTVNSTDNVYKLRHMTQSVQNESLGPKLIGGFFNNIESQIEYILSIIQRSGKVTFIHCIQPRPIVSQSLSDQTSGIMSASSGGRGNNDNFDVPYVRSQLQSLLLIDSVRACNRGYPERLPFRDFRRRFQCLIQSHDTPKNIHDALDDRGAVKKILEAMDIDDHRYRLGISQVLLRSDILVELEEKRDFQLSGLIESLQRECRLHLSRKWLEKRRLQEMAIRCIQKNAQLYLNVREWKWWKLYVRVKPLLGVSQQDEASREWRERVYKLESTNTTLRSDNTKYEGKLAELEQLLRAATQGSQALSLSLEHESEMRNRLEQELLTIKQKIRNEQGSEAEKRRSIASTSASPVPKSFGIDEWQNHPKTAELKQEVSRLKENQLAEQFKAQKATEQLQDLQSEITTLRSKHDSYDRTNSNVQNVINQKEAIIKTLEDKNSEIQRNLTDLQIKENSKIAEIKRLSEENADLKHSLTKTKRYLKEAEDERQRDGASVADYELLRRNKRELEESVKKLEEELEEITSHNHQLSQNITRLEMAASKLKNEKKREIELRESEISEMRSSHQRQYRALEEEIDSLTKTNHSLMIKNRQLESDSRQMQTHHQSVLDLSSNKYKKEYKKTLALLRDAQAVIAAERKSVPGQSHLRQLKIELEDAEAAKANALKEKTTLENELNELRCQLEILISAKKLVDDKNMTLLKERNNLKLLLDEHDEQFRELVKKYKAHIQQSQMDSITLTAQADTIAQLEATVRKLNDELTTVTEDYQKRCNNTVDIREHNRILLKLRDIEAKYSIEQAQKQNAESRIESYRDELESTQDQLGEAQQYRDKEIEAARKAVKERLEAESQIKDLRRKLDVLIIDLDKSRAKYDTSEQELRKAHNDLKISQKRIEELQAALYSEISMDGDSESDDEAMGGDSIGDEDDSDLPIGDLRPLRNSTPKDQYNGVFA
uniref:Uncharacterized protein n=1 Tax=Panagrolaimus sp. ES5 TaxID=591445 RepID=A0AC34FAZ7_9BILA